MKRYLVILSYNRGEHLVERIEYANSVKELKRKLEYNNYYGKVVVRSAKVM